MGSTDIITYLNYMSTWDTESDENIDVLIAELNLFVKLDSFVSDPIVDQEFETLIGLAMDVRDNTIAEDAIQISADIAAVASIWSFGLGMAAFVALETAATIEKKVISDKSQKLSDKLTTIDTDISSQINPDVNNYVISYKKNNKLISSKAPKGLDTKTCRSLLMQFMAAVQKREKKLDAETFRRYASSARIVFNSQEISKIYDAFDELNFSGKTEVDVKKFMNVLGGLQFPGKTELYIVQNFTIAIMFYKLKIANNTIETAAKDAGIPIEDMDASAFETMDSVGKFAAVVTVLMSVVDIVLNIYDIVNVVEQCNAMCLKLKGEIRDSYKGYFNGIRTAAQLFKKATNPQ